MLGIVLAFPCTHADDSNGDSPEAVFQANSGGSARALRSAGPAPAAAPADLAINGDAAPEAVFQPTPTVSQPSGPKPAYSKTAPHFSDDEEEEDAKVDVPASNIVKTRPSSGGAFLFASPGKDSHGNYSAYRGKVGRYEEATVTGSEHRNGNLWLNVTVKRNNGKRREAISGWALASEFRGGSYFDQDKNTAAKTLAGCKTCQQKLDQGLANKTTPLKAIAGQIGKPSTSGFIRPVSGGRTSSNFGWRMHPILHRLKFHDGADIAVPIGTTVRAAKAGRVVAVVNGCRQFSSACGAGSGWQGYGNIVVIDHGGGVITAYAHMSPGIVVRPGMHVEQGQVLGNSGQTGMANGPHLHMLMHINGRPVDPLRYIPR